jgi:hypothetical protein
MEREERERHDVENRQRAQYVADHGHPEGPVRNPDGQPRPRSWLQFLCSSPILDLEACVLRGLNLSIF